VRAAAAGALGWWAPFDPEAVMRTLRHLRQDRDDPTRQAAVAALARLGERAALAEIASGLRAEEVAIRVATAARIAAEEISWLWPDVQEQAETAEPRTALACAEATERLREHVLGPLG
jgi:HEAT repeat protein